MINSICRHVIAILHFNENVHRQSKKTKDGCISYNIHFPKFKLGEEVVREVSVHPTYGNYFNFFLHVLHIHTYYCGKLLSKYFSCLAHYMLTTFFLL